MNVLCVCENGQYRSQYLASYLSAKGYETMYGGSLPNAPNPVTQAMLDRADRVVAVSKRSAQMLRERFSAKNVVELDVESSIFVDEMHRKLREQADALL